jgi:PAS domain S-box-containing protein
MPNDNARLEALRSYEILDTPTEADFDEIAALASRLCDTPMALVSLVAEQRQWFKAEVGLGVRETPIEQSVCACVMREPGPLQIEDLRADPRFARNPLVTGRPHLRFYAGAPLRSADGFALGMLCVLDVRPRSLSDGQLESLRVLARQVVAQMEARRQAALANRRALALEEAQKARRALLDAEERAAMAAEAAEIGIYDWDPRTDRLLWSRALREHFGLERAEEVTLDAALQRVHPDDRECVAQAIGRALDPAGDGRYEIEYRTIPRAGEVRWLHVLGRVRFEEREGGREATRFSGVAVNITKQKSLEQALRFQLDLTRNITDNATTAILMMDEGGRCTFMNAAAERMTGYSLAEVTGGLLHDFIHHHHPDGRPYPVQDCPIDRALPEQFDVVAHEDVFVSKTGEFFPVVVNAKPIRKDGVAVGTVIEVRDVTVERETIQRLRELSLSLAEADRRKDEFLATLAHELRNPLSPIRTASSLLTTASLPPERLSWASQVINRQVSHMARLLDDLLDMARITRGKLSIEPRGALLSEVVEAAVETARPLVDEKRHQLRVQLPQGACHVWLDPFRISQVLANLLVNAARYTPAGGRIEVEARVENAELVLSVSDNGVGLEPEELGRVFEMFAQGKAGTSSTGGLGIGLALSKALAQLHGGDVSARSEGAGRGCVFEIRLPGALDRKGGDRPRPRREAPCHGLRVLLADDNRDAADTLALMLQTEGHDVRVAYDGRGALKAAGTFKPQALVLDIGMPDMTGYEVVRKLRRETWARGALFIAVTGWGQQADKELAVQFGFQAHVTKPADPGELAALLRDWAAGRTPLAGEALAAPER